MSETAEAPIGTSATKAGASPQAASGRAVECRERCDWSPVLLTAPNLFWLAPFMAGAPSVLVLMSFRGYEPGGPGVLEKLKNTDWSYVTTVRPQWTQRWTREISSP